MTRMLALSSSLYCEVHWLGHRLIVSVLWCVGLQGQRVSWLW